MALQFDIRSIEDIERQEARRLRQEARDAPRPILPDPDLELGV